MHSRTGDFNPTSLAHVINTSVVNNLVVQTWLDRAGARIVICTLLMFALAHKLVAERKSTLIFCVNLAHLRDLTQTFRNAGIDARYVYSKTPAAERRVLVNAFRAGEFPVLLNVGTSCQNNLDVYRR